MRGATVFSGQVSHRLRISIHAPHAGRDVDAVLPVILTGDISIHAPHAGRDFPAFVFSPLSSYFNPRAPCGARHNPNKLIFIFGKFQSTRPMRGATFPIEQLKTCTPISIHAPHAGRDKMASGAHPNQTRFQSTRPMRGATASDYSSWVSIYISIHAPHAGRDML